MMTTKKLSDEKIIEGVLAQDATIYQYLYREYGPIVLAHVIKNNGSRTDGQEVLQITMLKVWDNIRAGKYESRGKLGHFIYMVGANTWKEELRRRRRRPTQALGKTEEYLADETEEDLFRVMVKEKNLNAIYRALKRMGDFCKEILELYHLKEVPLKEIAVQKNYKYNNLRKRIFGCRNKLKKLAEEELKQN